MLEWRPAAGKRTSNALIPIVGAEAVNEEDHKTFCGDEEPADMRSKTEYAQRERERHKEYVYIHTNATVTMTTN